MHRDLPIYGGLAAATNSILSGLALHVGGDVFSFMRLWTTGQPEWQAASTSPPLVWQTGVDFAFVRSVIVLVVLCAAAAWAYRATRRVAREQAPSAA